MGIARALERVKRQARQGGLQGVITGLGRELRSDHVPVPLRAAAQRIAALLPIERAGTDKGGSGAPASGRKSAGVVTHADDLVVAAAQRAEAVAPVSVASVNVAQASVVASETEPREGASSTGTDDGAEPGPVEPEVGTPVDPEAVGATPEVVASPVEVSAVDASPVDVRSTDASPIEVEPVAANPIVAQLEPDDVTVGADAGEPEVAAASSDKKPEEELAPTGEEAKNLARSGSRSKKRSRSKGTTSKKK